MQQARDFLRSCENGWRDRNDFCFGIFDSRDAGLLGTAGLNQFQKLRNMASLGYWVRSDCTGRGITTLDARAVARFGFSRLLKNPRACQLGVGGIRCAMSATFSLDTMRKTDVTQHAMFSYRSLEERIPDTHPLRKLRILVDGICRA